MEKSDDEEEDEDSSNNNVAINKSTNGTRSDVTTMTEVACSSSPPTSPNHEHWHERTRSPSISPELEVDSPPRSPAVEVTIRTPSPVAKTKKSEAFSVSALLRPDLPKAKRNPEHYPPSFQETISVTRSLFYPGLPFSDVFLRDKDSGMPTSPVNLIPRHFLTGPGFPLHSGLYPTPPKDSSEIVDANRNLLTGSFYLSLGAVQAAAAAAMANSSVPQGTYRQRIWSTSLEQAFNRSVGYSIL